MWNDKKIKKYYLFTYAFFLTIKNKQHQCINGGTIFKSSDAGQKIKTYTHNCRASPAVLLLATFSLAVHNKKGQSFRLSHVVLLL